MATARRFAAIWVMTGTMAASAQNYAIDWSSISCGGGVSSSPIFAVAGTVGQPAVGRLSGGRYAMDTGFWSIATAVQTPGAPWLSIRAAPSDMIAISWASSSGKFTLQSSSSVFGENWVPVSTLPVEDGLTNTVVLQQAGGNHFFRLIQP
jgi:hypothetical protein